jgi:prevent-host-death family protein
MTIQMNIAQAKAKLSELVAQAEAGEEVILARGGKPVAKLSPVAPGSLPKRVPGLWSHLGPIDPNLFLEPDPELIEAAEAADEDHLYLPPERK